ETAFLAARYAAGVLGKTAEEIHNEHAIPMAVAEAAVAHRLDGAAPDQVAQGQRMRESYLDWQRNDKMVVDDVPVDDLALAVKQTQLMIDALARNPSDELIDESRAREAALEKQIESVAR